MICGEKLGINVAKFNIFKMIMGHLLPRLVGPDGEATEMALTQYKGNSGKVAVVGGSIEYTGAPFYSAIAALRAGADLSHIYCPDQALIPIKCYSPEIIVHPIDALSAKETALQLIQVARTIVFGPGLGRSPYSQELLQALLKELIEVNPKQTSFVFDADALWYVANDV
jgi:ATP-dependent NAD(P)H-hydrate dehydratase